MKHGWIVQATWSAQVPKTTQASHTTQAPKVLKWWVSWLEQSCRFYRDLSHKYGLELFQNWNFLGFFLYIPFYSLKSKRSLEIGNRPLRDLIFLIEGLLESKPKKATPFLISYSRIRSLNLGLKTSIPLVRL